MKRTLAFLVVAGLISFSATVANSQTAQPNYGPEIKYAPEQRFAMPFSKVTGLDNAKNVVIKEVTFDSLPEYFQIQAKTDAETCTGSADNKKLIKYYRYISDATRNNSLSANYLFDFAPLASKSQQACVLGPEVCNKDGCLLVGYNSTAYEKWSIQFSVRQKSWDHRHYEDPKNKSTLTVFELKIKCKATDAAEKRDDKEGCTAKRVWLERGLVEYTESGLLDNVAPFNEPARPDAPDEDAPAPDETNTQPSSDSSSEPSGEPAQQEQPAE